MTGTTSTARAETRPRTSTLDRATLMHLAATEYGRVSTLLDDLSPSDWARPTECSGWDVRAMAGHVLGMAEMAASMREGIRQQRRAKKRGGLFIDALTALQVEERAALTPQQLTHRFQAIGPRAARSRRRAPSFIRRMKMSPPQEIGGMSEIWTMGYLIDTIETRDPWMHRIDIARATGRSPHLTADHDAILIADIVQEWAGRHGKPCRLHLTGPAGGSWTFGDSGPLLELDAIEFCRTVSGREQGTDLLGVQVPF